MGLTIMVPRAAYGENPYVVCNKSQTSGQGKITLPKKMPPAGITPPGGIQTNTIACRLLLDLDLFHSASFRLGNDQLEDTVLVGRIHFVFLNRVGDSEVSVK